MASPSFPRNLSRLPKKLLEACSESLDPHTAEARLLAAKVASQLLRLSANTIRAVGQKVRAAGWAPYAVTDRTQASAACASPAGERDKKTVMQTLVREALHNVAMARPDDCYVASLARLQQHYDVDIGDKYSSPEFLKLAEFMGAKLLEFWQAEALVSKLPGLKTASPLAVAFDTVSIGESMFARSETFQIIVVSTLSADTGRLQPYFLACPSAGMDHDGASQATSILETMGQHAAPRQCTEFSPDALRRS